MIELYGLHPVEGANVPINSNLHTLELTGLDWNGKKLAVSLRFATAQKEKGVTMQLAVRAEDLEVCQLVIDAVE